jgi:hypothetical protein
MKTKLTLSVDKNLVHFAHSKARIEGTSVSAMFSRYLYMQKVQSERSAAPSVKAMIGALKEYEIDDSKSSIRSSYVNKYLR